MKITKLLLFICSLLLITACKKSTIYPPDTKVFGYITDFNTGKALDKANIFLKEGPNGTTHNQIVVKTVITEDDGYYEIKFYKEKYAYWIDVNRYGYQTRGYFQITKKGDIQYNIELK